MAAMPSSAERRNMLWLALIGEQAGMHMRVQGLDPTVEHLGKAGDLLDRSDRNTGARNGFRGRAGRNDVDAGVVQAAGELGETGLVVDADQCTADRPAPIVLGHPMVAFRPVQVTPRVATAAKTSTSSCLSTTLIRSCRVAVVVVVEDGHRLLRQDRPGVRACVDEVHGASSHLDTVCQRIRHRVRTRERGQQRRMRVENAADELGKKLRTKDFHEPGGHDQIGLIRRGGFR